MTIFASTPPRMRADVTSDGYGPNGYPMVKVPRSHEANPILVAFRDSPDYSTQSYMHEVVLTTEPIEWDYPFTVTPEQIAHARKVLTRLAALSTDPAEHRAAMMDAYEEDASIEDHR